MISVSPEIWDENKNILGPGLAVRQAVCPAPHLLSSPTSENHSSSILTLVHIGPNKFGGLWPHVYTDFNAFLHWLKSYRQSDPLTLLSSS